MTGHRELERMAAAIRELNLESRFPELHHFSTDKFSVKPPTLEGFVTYCERIGEFDANGENPQTIRRAMLFAEKVKQGQSPNDAIASAWQDFPLVTR